METVNREQPLSVTPASCIGRNQVNLAARG